MTPTRQLCLTSPGQWLLTTFQPQDTIETYVQRPDQWLHMTGMDREDIVLVPTVSIPLPRYERLDHAPLAPGQYDTRRRFSHVNPRMMWHPLFWLPADRAEPWVASDGTAETNEEWALRICLEMQQSGLYHAESGTWHDVLGAHGIDITTPEGLKRVELWQSGISDDVLDSIDLTPQLAAWDYNWSIQHVAELLYGVIQPATWGRLSADLMNNFDILRDTSVIHDPASLAVETDTLVGLGLFLVGEAPMVDGSDLIDEWGKITSVPTTGMSVQHLQAGPIAHAFSILHRVATTYGEALKTVSEYQGDLPH